MTANPRMILLLESLEAIFTAPEVSLAALAKAGGLDPRRDFRNISLNGVPLDDQDVRGFDFSDSDLRGTNIQKAKRDNSSKFFNALFDGPSLDPVTVQFNRSLRPLRLREAANELLSATSRGVKPDVITFNTMIAKSPDLANAERIKKIAAESGF